MATIVLGAVGAAIGSSVGGTVLGVSAAVIGKAVGSAIGAAVDQRLMGAGSATVETGRVDRFRLMGASEGSAIAQVYGRMRVGGQVIWASQFLEKTTTSGGGKGAPSQPEVTQFSYSVSMAIALCEGEISRVGRIWADGQEISSSDLNMRVYKGSQTQLPDPKIEAVEGAGNVPAYRGVAYVVLEDLELAAFGNRVPQFTFEVMRPAQKGEFQNDMSHLVRAVAMIPGSGEYSLATEPVYLDGGFGETKPMNLNSNSGETDFTTSLQALSEELTNCRSTSLIVSWFGDDLRCGSCEIQPKVEQSSADSQQMPWQVAGVSRSEAALVPSDDQGRPIYGGTPSDQSVVQAIEALKASGQKVMFYPFILMDQIDGNTLPNPWEGTIGQPKLPWRGRITTSLAPHLAGTPDETSVADDEVARFFGQAQRQDFTVEGQKVIYHGVAENSFRKMILHYAHLCAASGGVEAFCIGSEMRSLTQIRGANGFPAVEQLINLAEDVRHILGPQTKIGYAADWSEYFGYQTGNNVYYHLDPLWAHNDIDFIGIDNYMPLSDWRDGDAHADVSYCSIYNLEYLKDNIEGGEGYDWYYANQSDADQQIRSPITDGAYNEPWVYRYKDIRSWWENEHYDRLNGVRSTVPTSWVPQSKPIWFTELGCAAIDRGTNQPNKFLDAKSSESSLPAYSNGRRDDFIQLQYMRAMSEYWGDAAHNPLSIEYGAPMVDMANAHVWAWDARPFPAFPTASHIWSDGDNYDRGHWLNGRSTARSLADVVAEICSRSGVQDIDVSELWGILRGYSVADIAGARSALQPLMLAYGFEAVERNGKLIFKSRGGKSNISLTTDIMVRSDELEGEIELSRVPDAEIAGQVQINFIDIDRDFSVRSEGAGFATAGVRGIALSELPIALTRGEGQEIAQRWLAESRVARDSASFVLPPSLVQYGAGDIIEINSNASNHHYRIDHLSQGLGQTVKAIRIESDVYRPSDSYESSIVPMLPIPAPAPVSTLFLDLPLIRGDESPHNPYIAAVARPWSRPVAVYHSSSDSGYALERLIQTPSRIGITQNSLERATAGIWDRGAALRVKMINGALSAVSEFDVFNGANLVAIGDGEEAWEVFQFAQAHLVGEREYEISMRLRGQLGTDALNKVWPAGSKIVMIDGHIGQLDLPISTRGLDQHFRIGPAVRPNNHPSYRYHVETFETVGLRPYAPVHLKSYAQSNGETRVSWIRRTRIDGDSWQSFEVPLGEGSEGYLVQVLKNGQIIREEIVNAPMWVYSALAKVEDNLSGAFEIQVAQISESYGAGLFRRISVNG